METVPENICKLYVLASRILEAIRMLSVFPKCMDNLFSSNHPRIAFSSMLRGITKLKKFQKSQKKPWIDLTPPTPNQTFFWKPITDLD